MPRNPGQRASALAPERCTTSATSTARKRVLTATVIAPRRAAPSHRTRYAGQLGSQRATRSPRPTPSSERARAARRAASSSSAKVRRPPRYATAVAPGVRDRTSESIRAMVCIGASAPSVLRHPLRVTRPASPACVTR